MALDTFSLSDPLTLATLAALAIAWGLFAWIVGGIVVARRISLEDPSIDSMERKRIQTLREKKPVYRWFEPLVVELASINRRLMNPLQEARIENELAVARASVPWKPAEYYGVKQTESLMLGGVLFVILCLVLPWLAAALIAAMVAAINLALAIFAIPQVAAARRNQFKRRLPHAIDIMALLLEAGSNFDDAVRVVAREDRDSPLGVEFQRLKQQLDLNRSQSDALNALRDRIQDEDTSDLVRAICQGIELGTPMSSILKTQSDQMRLKRSQWGEKAAKEAEVKMTGPNLLIMLACVIVIMGPILLPILYGEGVGF
jgi:tight adherence protein C